MKVMVLDSGGRGHVLAWMFKQDPNVKEVICAPGNAGIVLDDVLCPNLRTKEDFLRYAREEKVDLVFVGPESYLGDGVVDLFREAEIPIIGPTKTATILESSKAYTKMLCYELDIPVATFANFRNLHLAKKYVNDLNYPVVVKADGFARGKGSIVCSNTSEALTAINTVFEEQAKGNWKGEGVVIEKRLKGRELSFFFFTDGTTVIPMPVAQDFKRAYDQDEGPNTGGMGSYSPHLLEGAWVAKMAYIYAQRLVNGLKKKRGISYQGILYLGTMFSNDSLYLLEINVRHGDPEAEVIMPRLKTSLTEICRAIYEGKLGDIKIEWSKEYFCDVVAAAGRTRQIGSDGRNKGWYPGYPGRYGKGYAITGYDQVDPAKCKIFFAGAENHPEKGLITTGGRVLHVVGRGPTLEVARDNAYTEIQKINFEGMRYRKDIGRIY